MSAPPGLLGPVSAAAILGCVGVTLILRSSRPSMARETLLRAAVLGQLCGWIGLIAWKQGAGLALAVASLAGFLVALGAVILLAHSDDDFRRGDGGDDWRPPEDGDGGGPDDGDGLDEPPWWPEFERRLWDDVKRRERAPVDV